jgi:hypothetical protein
VPFQPVIVIESDRDVAAVISLGIPIDLLNVAGLLGRPMPQFVLTFVVVIPMEEVLENLIGHYYLSGDLLYLYARSQFSEFGIPIPSIDIFEHRLVL